MTPKEKENLKTWVSDPKGLPADAVNYAEELGKTLVDLGTNGRPGFNKMTTSQVRNFFGEVRRIQMKGFDANRAAFVMLKPKLAYAVARARRENKIHTFKEVVVEMLPHVSTSGHYENFVNFLEAIVAFHKANGGE